MCGTSDQLPNDGNTDRLFGSCFRPRTRHSAISNLSAAQVPRRESAHLVNTRRPDKLNLSGVSHSHDAFLSALVEPGVDRPKSAPVLLYYREDESRDVAGRIADNC